MRATSAPILAIAELHPLGCFLGQCHGGDRGPRAGLSRSALADVYRVQPGIEPQQHQRYADEPDCRIKTK
jgi:hypothetical protein